MFITATILVPSLDSIRYRSGSHSCLQVESLNCKSFRKSQKPHSSPISTVTVYQSQQNTCGERCEPYHKLCLAASEDLHQSKALQIQTTVNAKSSAVHTGTTRRRRPSRTPKFAVAQPGALPHLRSSPPGVCVRWAGLHRRRWEVSRHVFSSCQHHWKAERG